MQTGQDLGVVIMVQTDAADQELLVDLPDHGAGAAGLTLGHGDGHSEAAQGPLTLHTQHGGKQEKGQEGLEEAFKQGEEGVFAYPEHVSHNAVNVLKPHPSPLFPNFPSLMKLGLWDKPHFPPPTWAPE